MENRPNENSRVLSMMKDRDGRRELLLTTDPALLEELRTLAAAERDRWYGKTVFIRGLIEFSNYCKNDCCYCGIRRSNRDACRYRLTDGDIRECCKAGHELGFGTFVLQGGEDGYFTDERLSALVSEIKNRYPECAVTLSVGERSRESYQTLFNAGADRYLLRHETADPIHYGKLHPDGMTLENRKRCLYDLKEIGYQVGAGMMIGSPGQTAEQLLDDLEFLEELQPDMVGIGPFIPHHATPFANEPAGTVEMTIRLLSMTRLLLPKVLLPATTALGTLDSFGREKGMMAGANVVMPNLSPETVRKNYLLYDNKACTGTEAAEGLELLKQSMEKIGYQVVMGRGDRADWKGDSLWH